MSPPTRLHQKVTGQLFYSIETFLRGKSCEVYIAPFNVRFSLVDGVKRVEPDISVICDKSKLNQKGCEGAPDFIIEVVSPGNKMHDYTTKVSWYREAGVKEYWIVNPMAKQLLTYCFDKDEVYQYTFEDSVIVGIWEGEFAINFKEIDLT
jgi:Uma2 family endonuclease